MKGLLMQLKVQFRMDLRDKGVLLVHYIVPLLFYIVMGSIMSALSMEPGIPLILALTSFAIAMPAFLGMPSSLVRAREHGVYEAFRAAGAPGWGLTLAIILISVFHILIVSALILLTAPTLFRAAMPPIIIQHCVTVLLVAVSSEAIGAFASCFVKKQTTMSLVSQVLFLPSILFSGIMFPQNLLPKPMQIIGGFLPATMGMRLFEGGKLSIQPLFTLIGTAIAAFIATALLLRRIGARA